ncbi:hypothetical protein LWF01_17870 [Saxibacter everestensis]|uniref:Uncharacterized protein n=1 Tax=Saxibacter everestensis TaxID=2909229 RepID=A0ABY8QUS4_9MICO|nr:hypothetical protein LWF01_17870 [Brevibacteriaceae bacterium ZFBP1038]
MKTLGWALLPPLLATACCAVSWYLDWLDYYWDPVYYIVRITCIVLILAAVFANVLAWKKLSCPKVLPIASTSVLALGAAGIVLAATEQLMRGVGGDSTDIGGAAAWWAGTFLAFWSSWISSSLYLGIAIWKRKRRRA